MRVSVCMATYNGGKYIKQQLDSILSQLSDDDEVIISDDGSKDNTLDIVESYNDSRIVVFHHQTARKRKHYSTLNIITRNFENALCHASGEYIFLSDQDDIWCPNKVSRTIENLKQYDFVISSYNKIDAAGNPYNGSGHNNSVRFDKRLHNNFIMQWLQGPYFGCACAMTKKFRDFALPIPNYPIHDRYLGLLAKRMKVLHHIDEPLILYRIHGSNNSSAENNTYVLKCWMRLKLLFYVVVRPYIKKY